MSGTNYRSAGIGGSIGDGSGDTGGEAVIGHPSIPFPFEPYDVQRQLMGKIYETLEKGGIGIFESPTGTVSTAVVAVVSPARRNALYGMVGGAAELAALNSTRLGGFLSREARNIALHLLPTSNRSEHDRDLTDHIQESAPSVQVSAGLIYRACMICPCFRSIAVICRVCWCFHVCARGCKHIVF